MCIRDRFGSELDADTSEKLAQGERLKEILKQPQYQPMPVAKPVSYTHLDVYKRQTVYIVHKNDVKLL